MANKAQQIFELSQTQSKQLSDIDNWTSFLRSASWQYKYPFEDQLLIFAQRPDATACATHAIWNGRLKRWINRGAKGIALLRENAKGHYLDYVFDISDTNSFYGNEVKLWKYNEKYDAEIIETLEGTFGTLENTTTVIDAVMSAAHNAVTDNKADYLHELRYLKHGSLLSGLDAVNIDKEFQSVAEASIAYTILSRLGLSPDEYIEREDFQYIVDFNTPTTISLLGNVVSDISEQALIEISDTIRSAEREEIKQNKNSQEFFAEKEKSVYNISENKDQMQNIENQERTDENGSINIHSGGRLQKTELDSSDTDGDSGQIWDDETRLSQETQTESVLSNEGRGNFDETSVGDGQGSERTSGNDSIADGEVRRSDGADESGEPKAVGWTYEQPQAHRRRNRNEQPSSQLSLFDLIPTEEQQKDIIREAARNTFGAAFSMPQQIIDEVLCDGTHEKNSVIKICVEFSKNKSIEEKAEFLKNLYGKDGKGFIFDDKKVSAIWNSDGIHISYGTSVENANTNISWEQAAKRIDELLDIGRYAPTDVLLTMREFELSYIAEAYWFMQREINYDKYPDLMPILQDGWHGKGGAPEEEKRIAQMLKDTEQRHKLREAVRAVLEHNDSMRFRTIFPPIVVYELISDLDRERKSYISENLTRTHKEGFITENEINAVLKGGSNISQSRYRIYLFFQNHTDKNERVAFLKNEYGIGGTYDGKSNISYDAKGIEFSRGNLLEPYSKTIIKWTDAERRIDKIIKDGQYLTDKDIENIPNYQIQQLSQAIYHARSRDESVADFLPGMVGYDEGIKIISEKLKDRQAVAEMLENITALVIETPKDDRYYRFYQEAKTALERYQNGEYNLFSDIAEHDLRYTVELEYAKQLINEFVDEEYDSVGADFSVLSDINLAYTTTEDEKHEIQASVDLIGFKIERYIDDELIERKSYDSLAELIDKELHGLSFDDLVYVSDEDIARVEQLQLQKSTTEPASMSFEDFYNHIHSEDNGDTVALFPVGDFYEIYGIDAEKAAPILGINLTTKTIDSYGYAMCGFPKHSLEQYVNDLNSNGFDVVIVDENRKTYKVISNEKALGTTAEVEEVNENDTPEERLAKRFGITADEVLRLAKEADDEVRRRYNTSKRSYPTVEERNYRFIKTIAPQILDGTATYMRFTAGKSFMPLVINDNYNGRISITHYYNQHRENITDPDMTFAVDNEAGTLSARSFEQGVPPIYQEAVEGDRINQTLVKQLNSFAATWFSNIKHHNYVLERMNVP